MKLSRRTLRLAIGLTVLSGPGCQSSQQFIHRPAWMAPRDAAAEVAPSAKPTPQEGLDAANEKSLADELPAARPQASPFRLVAHEQPLGPSSLLSQFSDDSSRVASPVPAQLSLEEVESLALANNPTLRELAATTQKAAGYRTQVSLRANPTVGYQGVQLADEGTDQHTAFVEQEIVRGNKLELNRRVQNEALRAQLLELEAQRWRVITDVRRQFYQTLVAQRRVELIREFQAVTDQGLELAELRKRALEGSQIDVLQASVQKNEIDLALRQAEVALTAAWTELAALSGTNLPATAVVGQLPSSDTALDWSAVTDQMLATSPERQVALTRVAQARANLQRQQAQPIPNLLLQFAAGVDNGTNSEMMNVQVGAPLPVFNQNQGNIAAAHGEYCRAVMEVQRVENSIKSRLAAVSQDYDSALAAVTSYSDQILPSAEQSLQLAELAYKSGETNFIQVLVARRTYFDSNLQYLQAQGQLAQAQAQVDGFVLTGALAPIDDQSGDDSLRGLTFSPQ